MSGWTHITVEPAGGATNNTLSKQTVYQISKAASKLSQSADYEQEEMLGELADLVADAQTQLDEKKSYEVVEAYLQDLVDDLDGAHTRKYPETPTVRWPSRGEDCSGIATTILDECDAANRVLVVAANDTTDSGTGWLYEEQDGTVKQVDETSGYMGAQAKDVIGYFREEHDIDGRANA